MDELKSAMLAYVQSAGGSVAWEALVAAMPPNQRARIGRAFEELKAEGYVVRTINYDPSTGLEPLMVKAV